MLDHFLEYVNLFLVVKRSSIFERLSKKLSLHEEHQSYDKVHRPNFKWIMFKKLDHII